MKLTYRGQDYESHPQTPEFTSAEISGKYRGGIWKRHHTRQMEISHLSAECRYRGIAYHIGD